MNQHPEIIAAKFHKIIPVNLSIYCCRCQHLYNFMNAWIGFCNRRKSVYAWLIFKWIHYTVTDLISHYRMVLISPSLPIRIDLTSDLWTINVNMREIVTTSLHLHSHSMRSHRIHSSTIKITSSSIEFHTFCSKSIDGAERDGATSQTLCPDRTR